MAILEPIYRHNRERIAVRTPTTLITYGRLTDDIDTMAQWLLAQGLEPGDRVTLHPALLANTSYWDWIAQLGAIRAGLVQSTRGIPPALAVSGAVGPHAAAIGDLGSLDQNARPQRKLPFAPKSSEPLANQVDLPPQRRALGGLEHHGVRLLTTSGTTGTPKVLAWDADLFAGRLQQVREIGDITPDSQVLTLLGLLTTTGLRYPIATWQIGATALLASMAGETTDFTGLVYGSTFIAASPFRMQQLLQEVPGEWPGRESRSVELFGGRVPPAMHNEILSRCCSALRMSYGATEVGRVAAGDTSLVQRHSGAAGMVEPNITVEIVDAAGNRRPAGEPGLVRLKSPFMCRGYLGAPVDAATSPFRDGWFYPGDIGILYDDGLFAITGRTSETINISGAKVSPVAIEEKLAAVPEIRDACVVALQFDERDVLGVAIVVDDSTDFPLLRQKIAGLVPRQYPLRVFRVQSIPRNAMGRIPRSQVARQLEHVARKQAADRGQKM